MHMKFKMLTDAELQQTSEPLAAKLQKQQRSFLFYFFFILPSFTQGSSSQDQLWISHKIAKNSEPWSFQDFYEQVLGGLCRANVPWGVKIKKNLTTCHHQATLNKMDWRHSKESGALVEKQSKHFDFFFLALDNSCDICESSYSIIPSYCTWENERIWDYKRIDNSTLNEREHTKKWFAHRGKCMTDPRTEIGQNDKCCNWWPNLT